MTAEQGEGVETTMWDGVGTETNMKPLETKITLRPSVTDQSPSEILRRASDFGKFWKMKAFPVEEMMEEFMFYADRLGVVMDADCTEYKCEDPECEWSEEAVNGLMFPHQVIHGMIYHSDGMTLFVALCFVVV